MPVSPAMQIGLTHELWTWPRVLSRRLFPGRESLSRVERVLYNHAWPTTVLPRNLPHDLIQAYYLQYLDRPAEVSRDEWVS